MVDLGLPELALLADTAGARVVGQTTQRLEHPNPATYVGKGKVQEIVSQRQPLDYSTVIFDDELDLLAIYAAGRVDFFHRQFDTVLGRLAKARSLAGQVAVNADLHGVTAGRTARPAFLHAGKGKED